MSPLDLLTALVEPTRGSPATWFIAFDVFFTLVFLAGLLLYLLRRRLFPGHSLHVKLAARFGTIGAALGAAGLLLLGTEYLQWPYMSMRLWLGLAVLAVVGLAGYLFYYWRRRYPAELAAFRSEQARVRFVKPTRPSAPASGGARRRSSKRHRK